MKCLVTGAAGFIGSELTRALLKEGFTVRALLHSGESDANIAGLPVEKIFGDMRDKNAIEKAVAGMDYVFHTASLYELTYVYTRYPKEMYDVNVEGTRTICQAALEAGVKKFVYTGSTGSIGCIPNTPTKEDAEFNMFKTRSHYEKSKALGEKTALAFHQKGLPVVSINPSFLIGPRDSRPSPTGEIILNFLNRHYPVYFDAPLTLSEMKGTIQAHLNALTRGVSGTRYIVTSDYQLTVKEYFQILQRVSGIQMPKIGVPLMVLFVVSALNEYAIGFVRLFGIGKKLRPLIAHDLMRYFSQGCRYDSSRAQRELGFAPEPIETAIRESVDWYVKNGYVKTSSCEKYYAHQKTLNTNPRH